jgi:hypothetical protein
VRSGRVFTKPGRSGLGGHFIQENERMTTQELNAAIAKATGEDISLINNLGFNEVDPFLIDWDPEPNDMPASMVDWDSPYVGDTICPYEVA